MALAVSIGNQKAFDIYACIERKLNSSLRPNVQINYNFQRVELTSNQQYSNMISFIPHDGIT